MILIPQAAHSILNGISDEKSSSLLRTLNSVVEFSDWRSLKSWLDLQPDEMLSSEYAFQWLETGLRLLPPPPNQALCINRLGRLVEALIARQQFSKQALDVWLPIALKNIDAIEIQETLNDCIAQIARNSPSWADAFPKYQLVVRDWDWNKLVVEINSLDQKWASEIPILKLLAIWLPLNIEAVHNVEKFIGIKASKGKWQFQIVQSLSNDINLNLIKSLNLVIEWTDQLKNTSNGISESKLFLDIVFRLATAGYELPKELIDFSNSILNKLIPSDGEVLFQKWFSKSAKINKLLNIFFAHEEIIPFPLALFWLCKKDAVDIVSCQPHIAEKTLESIANRFNQNSQNAFVIKNLRQQLGGLVDEMMDNLTTRSYAHKQWIKLFELWPEEAVIHLRHCLLLTPKEGEMAEDCLTSIMNPDNASQILDLTKALQQQSLKGGSDRIDRLIELIMFTRDLEKNSDITDVSKLESHHFAMVFNIFKPKNDPYQADMASELIRLLRERIYASWKTPLAYQVEALVYGNHIDDAYKNSRTEFYNW